MGKVYRVKNLEMPRGFIGLELLLQPGDNLVDKNLFQLISRRCPLMKDHRNSRQVVVLGGEGDKVRVRLEPRTDVGERRPPTLYRCHKYHFGADEEVELTEEQLEELRTSAYFRQLEGIDVQIRGVKGAQPEPAFVGAGEEAE